MKIRAIAWVTFVALLRNRLIILFFGVFACLVLLMMTPLLTVKAMAVDNPSQAQLIVTLITSIMGIVSGFGSLLAAWSAADSVASEMKSGSILAVMARPVRRWEFLLGKYFGVMMLMVIYVLFMFAVSNVLARIADARIVTNPWVLLVYPLVRYGIYAALAIWLVSVMHQVFAFVLVLFVGTLATLVSPSSGAAFIPGWLRQGFFFALPSINLLSESKFLALTSASLKQTPWTEHLTALTYGLDYAVVCFLFAAWAFRRRSLTRE